MSHEMLGLLGLAVTLLGVVITSTWRFSGLASKLLAAIEQQRADAAEVKTQLKALEKIPQHEMRIGQVELITANVPKLTERVLILEQARKFSKEHKLRIPGRGSRPDNDNEDD